MPIVEFMQSLLADNPYFGAGAGLAGLGAGVAVLKRSVTVATVVFRRRCMISMELNSNDYAYPWVLNWINAQSRFGVFRKPVQAGRNFATQHVSITTEFKRGESGRKATSFAMIPSPGDHYIAYRGRPLKVDRTREKAYSEKPFETVTLTSFGFSPDFFETMLAEAEVMNETAMQSGVVIYEAIGHEWRPFGHPRRKRPLASVVLEGGVSQRIKGDIEEFIGSSAWYKDRGVPYRRGYLLHGPPGCGKTCFIFALASELGYNICNLSLSDRALTDDRLNHLLNFAPQQSIVVLEDVDAAFASREANPILAQRYEGLPHLTFSGLLNAIDGVASGDSRILFMTTNYPERLDPALVRPGRADVKEFIGHCSDRQLAQLFATFYPEAAALGPQFAARLRAAVGEAPVSPAMVQNYFLGLKDDPDTAIASLDSFASVQGAKLVPNPVC